MPAQPNMDEILNTIRTDLAEETARVEAGAGGFDVDVSDDEVLALSDDDLVDGMMGSAEPKVAEELANATGLIDLNAFTAGGSLSKADAAAVAASMGDDVLGEALPAASVEAAPAVAEEPAAEAAPEPEAGSAEDEMDRLLAEIKQTAAAPTAVNDALLAVDEVAAEVPADEPAVEMPAAAALAPAAPAAGRVNLNLIPGAAGLQLALPAEILAEALRPLVQDWVSENLAQIVERLVAEEIGKLTKQ